MGSVLARSIVGLVSLAVVVAAFGASAAPIFVGFESDPEFLESDPACPRAQRIYEPRFAAGPFQRHQ